MSSNPCCDGPDQAYFPIEPKINISTDCVNKYIIWLTGYSRN